MNIKPTKALIVGALFLFAILWVSLMGLLSHVGGATRAPGTVGGVAYNDDKTIVAEITHVDRKDFHITLSVKVTGPDGKVVGGLSDKELEVWENGKPVALKKFTGAGQGAARVCLVMDTSLSMQAGGKFAGAKAAALALVQTLRDGDHFGLYYFYGKQTGQEVLPMGPLDPARRDQANKAIESIKLSGGTPMLGTMERALQALESVPGRRVMIVMTDGMDTGGANARNVIKPRLLEMAKKQNIALHMVSVGTGKYDKETMQELGSKTGGQHLHAPEPDQLKNIYVNIGEGLQKEYTLEYDSPNPTEDGSIRYPTVAVRSGKSGTQAESQYHVPGVIATGAQPAAEGTNSGGGSSAAFPMVFFPLAVVLALAFGVPYYMWTRPKSGVSL